MIRTARDLGLYMIKLSPELLEAASLDPFAEAELQAVLSASKAVGARLAVKKVDRKSDAHRFSMLGIELYQGRGVESMGPILAGR